MSPIFFKKGVPLCIIFVLIFSALALATEEEVVRLQGVMMALDLRKNVMIVNEKLFVLNTNTTIHNEKGSAITIDRLKPKTWVYIEGVKDRINRRIMVKKIYLLQRYIEDKEKHLYPFIQ